MTTIDSRTVEISALFDGELGSHECDPVFDLLNTDPEARANWQAYGLIADHLRQGPTAGRDVTAAVMSRLRAEPVIVAPRNLLTDRQPASWLAAAASVAGVGLVGWIAFAGNAPLAGGAAHAVRPAPTFASVAAAPHPLMQTVAQKSHAIQKSVVLPATDLTPAEKLETLK